MPVAVVLCCRYAALSVGEKVNLQGMSALNPVSQAACERCHPHIRSLTQTRCPSSSSSSFVPRNPESACLRFATSWA